uniref:EH domain-containing protein n=1 Tax=Pristionchus pacificus TaxID=54126 RepID=A0A8R1V7F2_PRIPA
MEWVMQTGNVPVAIPGKPGCLSGGGGGIVPPALLQESRIPPFYLEAIALCGANTPSALPNTALVYKLMVTSSLPRSVLSYIWSAVNRSLPGQLTRSEFFSALALIALAQRGESLVALCSMGSLPLPSLHSISSISSPSMGRVEGGGEGGRMSMAPLTPSTSSTSFTPSIPTPSLTTINQNGFIPTALLASGESGCTKKDLVDLSKNDRREMWERMMNASEEIVDGILKMFDQRTNDVVREVCRTEKGSGVISMIGLVINIMRRVSEADGREEMKKRVEKWHKKWKGIEQYSMCDKVDEQCDDSLINQRCDLCDGMPSSISYGGRFYHGECANLWVNHIDSVLPIHIQQ